MGASEPGNYFSAVSDTPVRGVSILGNEPDPSATPMPLSLDEGSLDHVQS